MATRDSNSGEVGRATGGWELRACHLTERFAVDSLLAQGQTKVLVQGDLASEVLVKDTKVNLSA
eukprot:5059957-Amphidinium_carterae.1